MDAEEMLVDDCTTNKSRSPIQGMNPPNMNFVLRRGSILDVNGGTNGLDEYNYFADEPKEKKAIKAI